MLFIIGGLDDDGIGMIMSWGRKKQGLICQGCIFCVVSVAAVKYLVAMLLSHVCGIQKAFGV